MADQSLKSADARVPTTITVHEGEDYVCLLGPKDTTDTSIGLAGTVHAATQREIARRYNAHTAMLAALEAAFIVMGRAGGNTASGPMRAEWEMARAAIALAKGNREPDLGHGSYVSGGKTYALRDDPQEILDDAEGR